ncbi:MAG: hypothetical protein CM1200mP10_23390 [Candidatus Neomarinimicrobiota bacterium]|nr:MAG: hypothetical protein CM1200mP10_23390 [Candidatus Neomarinimicrobiota bacterium]
MFGSTETTFYVLAVYFGSFGIRKSRHAIVAGLIADTVGILSAVYSALINWLIREKLFDQQKLALCSLIFPLDCINIHPAGKGISTKISRI